MRNKKLYSRFVSAGVATIMGLSSGLALSTTHNSIINAAAINPQHRNINPIRYAYLLDQDGNNETRIMMDGDNFLLDGYYMNAQLSLVDATKTGLDAEFNVKLQFQIPGYNINNLKFYVFDRNPEHDSDIGEYEASSSPLDPVPAVYLSNLTSSGYNVHVYNGSLEEENFVAKAEFTLWPNGLTDMTSATKVNLLNSGGATIYDTDGTTALELSFLKPSETETDQFQLALPTKIVPYYARTIKVVFFASERDGGKPPNIDRTLYDYFYNGTITGITDDCLEYATDASWGNDVEYEAHFYIDEVLPQNFLCKAEGITE